MVEKTVLITGAYGGLGRALCMLFGGEGYKVIALGRNIEKLDELSLELDKKDIPHQTYKCDISIQKDCEETFKKILNEPEGIDILINNAGITNISEYQSNLHIEIIQKVLQTNYWGAVYCTNYCLDSLKKQKGTIINISSVAGYAPLYGRTAYASSKFAMEGFFRTLATELKYYDVNNLMVYPTFIQTDIRNKETNATQGEVLTAEYVAQRVFKAFTKNKRSVYIGKTAQQVRFMYKFMPKLYEKMMSKRMKEKLSTS